MVRWFYPYIGWALFLIGLVLLLATVSGLVSFGGGWSVFFATVAAELAAIGQGVDMIDDNVEEEI